MEEREIIVETKNLTFTYLNKEKPALKNINLKVKEGEKIALLGPSGAGRSTLFYTLNGIIPHFIKGSWQGEVKVKGKDTRNSRVRELSQTVGILFEDFETQLFSTSVELEIAFGPENLSLKRDKIKERVEKYLRLTGIEHLRRREPSSLSGGEKQRLAIASLLSLEPSLLLWDHPTSDIDPLGRGKLREIIYQLSQEGKSLVVADNEIEELYSLERFILLNEGEIILEGDRNQVLKENISLLKSLGLKPPFLSLLSQKVGWRTLPNTLEEAFHRLKKEGWGLVPIKEENPPDTGSSILEVEEVEHEYERGIPVLKGINLKIKKGEFLALIGHNGAGKTTLLEILNGLLIPTKGRIRVEGEDLRRLSRKEIVLKMGYLFQNPDHQIFSSTVREEVEFTLKLFKFPEKEREERCKEALWAVGLEGKEEEDPFSLSKGERQRLALASLLARRPSLIFLDEPSTGLSFTERERFMKLLTQLNREGATVIMTTHSLDLVSRYARRVIVLHKGEILLEGPPREVFPSLARLKEVQLPLPPETQLSLKFGIPLLTWEEWERSLHLKN